VTCADDARAAGLSLAGTATRAERWLLVERSGAWGRDAVADTELPEAVRAHLQRFDGRVLLIRRPGARARTTVIHAVSAEDAGTATRVELGEIGELVATDPAQGAAIVAPVVLVCTHGRRDACCARLGVPTYDALRETLLSGSLWQSSHHGGHRFAANVLVLPWGVQLGRVGPADVRAVAAALASGCIPLEHYRGRTLYEPAVQAAEVALRRELGLDRVDDLQLTGFSGGIARFGTSRGDIEVAVEEHVGPVLPASCGARPEPAVVWRARLESRV
jgi:hypothetical protein